MLWSGGDFRFDGLLEMHLSVIIVNYNVRHFLEQCLCSVQKAIAGMQAEVIVVDNNSADNSLSYLRERFRNVSFIANTENAGFAKACNQGMKVSSGEYVLFLNPDCIVPEDCFEKCINFFRQHPDAGALGIKMLDGKGRFLKESKRSFPSPSTSLYKLFGLSKLFPRSKTFSRYHLGHLDENSDHQVDVLAGAFMLLKRKVLEETGGFDESFFMYGEDVDLSYRVQKAGYTNYYFAGSSIIHFKGESTRKGSMNYVRMFYNAMSIFVKKHYGGSRAGLFNLLIHLAIWLRAGMTAVGHFIRRIGLPLIDAGLILLSFWLAKNFWNVYVRPEVYYENKLMWIAFPANTIFYLAAAYFAGLYDKGYRLTRLFRSSLAATILLLAAYSLLPEQYRFSRAIVLLGAFFTFVFIALLRWLLVKTDVLSGNGDKELLSNTLVVGSPAEYQRVMELLKEAGLEQRVFGRISVNENDETAIAKKSQLAGLSQTIPFRELIYCEGTLQFSEIIELVQQQPGHIRIRIHAAGSQSIVGSDSRNWSGEALSKENGFNLSDPYRLRIKRLLDVAVAAAGIIGFPVHLLLIKRPIAFFANCFAVLLARKTWVGYALPSSNLPHLRPAVIASNGMPIAAPSALPAESLQMMDYWYARDYEPVADLRLIGQRYRHLGG